VNQIHNFSGYR